MKKTIVSLLMLCAAACLHGQDLHFSQFYETPLLRNPALAGIFTGQYRVQTVYRNQWQGIKGQGTSMPAYQTTGLGVEFKLKGYCIDDNSLTGGLQILRDRAGDSRLSRTMYLFSATYRLLALENLNVAAGFCGGPVVSNFNPDGLQWDDQFANGQFSPNNLTNQPMPANGKNYWDMGAGIALHGAEAESYQWYFGGAAYHINRPYIGFNYTASSIDEYRQKVRWTLNGGLVFVVNQVDNFKLYGDIMTQGNQNQYIFGGVYKKKIDPYSDGEDEGFNISAGCFYRFDDAVIPVMNLHWEKWTAGFSYDINVSRLSPASQFRGGFEFSLKYRGALAGKDCNRYGCDF